jgi:hypothetical protein
MNKLFREIILFVFAISFTAIGLAQSSTMYYMGTVPQSYYLNPATQPECNFYLGMPIASPLQFSYYNSGFSPNDLLWYDAEIDSNIHPLYSGAAADKFLSNLKDVEFLRTDIAVNLASFGFRAGDMYFSFDATIRGNEYFSYPKDLMTFVLKGNRNGDVFDFSALNFEFLNYAEFGVNISKSFSSTFSVGIRPKVLFGLGTFVTQDNDITLETNTDEWILNSKFSGKMAVTGMTIPVDEDGLIDTEGDFSFDSTITDDPAKNWNKVFSKNRGLGVDIGAHFNPVDDIQLSISALDLGYIKWKENPQVVSMDGAFHFQGYEWIPSDTIDYGEKVLDTIKANLAVSGTSEPFTTYLRPKIIVGGRVFLTPGFDLGLLAKTEFYKKKVNQDFTLLANWHPFTALSVSASYSLLNKTYSNFGLGLGLKLGPLNMYIISDYIPMFRDEIPQEGSSFAIPLPVDMYNANLRFGLNLVFGCNKAKRMGRDKPIFNSTNWMF